MNIIWLYLNQFLYINIMMNIKSAQMLVSQALEEIKTISAEEALQLSINNKHFITFKYF